MNKILVLLWKELPLLWLPNMHLNKLCKQNNKLRMKPLLLQNKLRKMSKPGLPMKLKLLPRLLLMLKQKKRKKLKPLWPNKKPMLLLQSRNLQWKLMKKLLLPLRLKMPLMLHNKLKLLLEMPLPSLKLLQLKKLHKSSLTQPMLPRPQFLLNKLVLTLLSSNKKIC